MWSVVGKSAVVVSAVGLVTAVLAPQSVVASTEENGLIAFDNRVRNEGGDRWSQVWTMRPDGTQQRMHFAAVEEENNSAVWSPDGRWLAFTRHDEVMVAHPDGTGLRLLDKPASSPSWSPDGTRLVYQKDRHIWTINADGTDRRMILGADRYYGPTWSPTGDLIAFSATDDTRYTSGDFEVYVYSIDGGWSRQLTRNEDPLDDDHITPVSDGSPTWSPDGSKILFSSTRDAPLDCNNCSTDFYLMNPDGSGQTRLHDPGDEGGATWSPDGNTIAYLSTPDAPHSESPWFTTRDMATGKITNVTQIIGWGVDWGAPSRVDAAGRPAGDHYRGRGQVSTRRDDDLPHHGDQRRPATRRRCAPGAHPPGRSHLRLRRSDLPRLHQGEMPTGRSRTWRVDNHHCGAATVGSPGTEDVVAMASSDTADPDFFNNRRVLRVAACTQLGTTDPDTLTGTEGNDVLCGRGGDDQLIGGGGNDLLLPGAGTDTVDGGTGDDTISYAVASRMAVDLAARRTDGEGVDTLSGIEDAEGSRFDDVLTGTAGANVLSGGRGDDRIVGGGGADRLEGGGGQDRFIPGGGDDHVAGGAGMDTVDLSGSPASVTVNLSTGVADGYTLDSLTRIEAAMGSRFADILRGSRGQNRLSGGRGADRISAMGGNDLTVGGRGADDLVGGDGNDSLGGGPGIDRCAQKTGSGTRTRCER